MKFLGKISILLLIIFFLAGCASPFSSRETEINLVKEELEISSEDIVEKAIEKNENVETELIENDIEKNKSNEAKQEGKEIIEENIVQEKILKETPKAKFEIKNKLVSWGFSTSQNRKIDTIIIHSSYNAVGSDPHDLDDIIYNEYKPYGVSPHYIISREGKVYRLVEDKNIAYHAGESKVPDGRTNVNNFSIGIEIVNTKSEKPNDAQYDVLKKLLTYLKGEYEIKYVLGHSDIASGRKDDPWNFDWKRVD